MQDPISLQNDAALVQVKIHYVNSHRTMQSRRTAYHMHAMAALRLEMGCRKCLIPINQSIESNRHGHKANNLIKNMSFMGVGKCRS